MFSVCHLWLFPCYFRCKIEHDLLIHSIFNNSFSCLFPCWIIKQQAIEASSDEMDYEIILPKIEAGGCYEIMNFCTNKMRGQYRVVPHDTHIMFTSKTIFNKLASVFPPIPCHRFFLQDYNRLYPRLNKLDILTSNSVCMCMYMYTKIYCYLFYKRFSHDLIIFFFSFKFEDVIGHIVAVQHLEPIKILMLW